MHLRLSFVLTIVAVRLYAQESSESPAAMKQVLERLDSLEKQNQELLQEIRSLRQEVKASGAAAASANDGTQQAPDQPTSDERLGIEERRTAEQAQTKVEAAHKYPIQLDGMVLFNAFANSASSISAGSYGTNAATQYGLLTGPNRAGATLRQTILGFDFQGPRLPGDGRVNGTLMMDFFGGSAYPDSTGFRIRRAEISLDWKNRSLTVGRISL